VATDAPEVTHECDILIIGAGPSGLYGAYYAGFRGWSVAVMDALPEVGGQITAMYPEKDIFDVAGFPAVKGRVLVEQLVAAAAPYSPTYLLGEQAVSLSTSADEPALVTGADGTTVRAKAVIITGGIGSFTPRALPADDGWAGRGLVYFVPRLADHADRDIVIVGGGDSAFDWAYTLAPIARSVALVHRREQFRAHGSMVDQVRGLGVRLFTSTEVSAIRGDGVIGEVEITHKTSGEVSVLPAQTVVAALGFVANIGPIAQWGVELTKRHITVDTAMRTNLPRVFAAGDIVTYEGKVPLISVGFGEAALAVNNAAPIVEPGMGIFPGHSSGGSTE
jgi:ferredoxin/flavodoxin---NADP+ reductase